MPAAAVGIQIPHVRDNIMFFTTFYAHEQTTSMFRDLLKFHYKYFLFDNLKGITAKYLRY